MTLILVTADEAGDIDVVADTLFVNGREKSAEIGPKIFLVPVTVSDLEEYRKVALPHMGFAFAGNVSSGQFTHALASTCLQNLAAPELGDGPDVEDVANFYAKCAVEIVKERRRHLAIDTYGFDGVVFGFSAKRGSATAYQFQVHVDAEGQVVAPLAEIELEAGIPHAVGSGAPAARRGIAYLKSRQIQINPFSLMYHVITEPSEPSVGGEFQAATASSKGVELRPVVHFIPKLSGGMDADFAVMGINLHQLGQVAGYIPIGNPQLTQQGRDLEFVAQNLLIDETIREVLEAAAAEAGAAEE